MRLIWLSNSVSGSMTSPEADVSQAANRILASRLAFLNRSRKPESSARGRSLRSRSMSVTQPSPTVSVSSRARNGLAIKSQRRGVTPLVLLLKRSGNISAKSFNTLVRSKQE